MSSPLVDDIEFDPDGYPLIILSHRKREFLETTLTSLRLLKGVSGVYIVDDSGDGEHRLWMLHRNYYFWASNNRGRSVGYLDAMQTVWRVARDMNSHVVVWEEDFVLTEAVDLHDMALVLNHNKHLAQINLQRQAVYKIERRFGYMQSHQRRGYDLRSVLTPVGRGRDVAWVRRRCPFTTNPGMIRREVLEIDWPTREECNTVPGGAEPAMSRKLERSGYHFGWLGIPNHPHTEHVGTLMKSGKGY